jgi:hypothetical protein
MADLCSVCGESCPQTTTWLVLVRESSPDGDPRWVCQDVDACLRRRLAISEWLLELAAKEVGL